MIEDSSEGQSKKSGSQTSSPPLIYRIKSYKPKTIKQTLSFMLIRPPRFLYNEELLLPPQKYSQVFQIEHYDIPFRLTLYKVKNMKYVILYLHGNSSSRFQGYMHLKQLPPNAGLACFDFNGCGWRFESEYITLGKNQSKDVDIAAKFLKKQGYYVVGWGRSMGSVSLLLSTQCDIMIADSPFCSLSQLCKQSSKEFLPKVCCCFFYCLYPCVFCCIREDVIERSGMDPNELQIGEAVRNQRNKKKYLYVMAADEDKMIPSSHGQKIYDAFPGKKKIKIFEGTHNSNRPSSVIRDCFYFIESSLGLQPHPCLITSPRKRLSKIHSIRIKPSNQDQKKISSTITQEKQRQFQLVQETSNIQLN